MAEYRDIYLLISEQLDEFDIYEVYDRIENDINKLTENYNVEHADALVELVCKVIPNIFSKQVNAMKADRSLFLRTNEFLRKLICFALLENQSIERLFDPLSVVFQLEHDFYAMKGMESNTIDAEYKSSLEEVAPNFVRFKDSADKRKMSVKAFNHLNYFANEGGVDKLINHAALQKASIDYCKRLVRFFYLLHDYISKDGKSRYVVRMTQTVFNCFLGFGDNDLKHVRKQDVEEMVSNLEVLTREVVHEKGDEMCERFCLEFSLKCFVCPILEKRLNGLVYIEEAVELAKNKMTFEDEFMAKHMMIKASRWLTVPYLVKRLKEAQLIPDLFGPQAHPQLIGKAKAIVGLFASQDTLDALEVDLIYNATKDPYLAVPTFELLMAVTPQLRGPTVKYLWSKVVQTPLIEFTGQHLQLVVRLARNGASSVDNALDLLWRIVISSDVKQEMRTQAMDEFITILKGAKNKRMQYLQTFFRQIIEGQQVVACMYLARKILEDFPTEKDLKDYPLMDMRVVVDGQTRMTRDNVLEALESDLKLLSAMATELYLYNDSVAAALEESWAGKGPFDVQEHQNQIKRRMDMLSKLIEWMPRSTLNASLDHAFIDLIWKIFYIDVGQKPYASIYNDIVFDWIRRLTSATIGKRVDAVLPPHVVLEIFHRCMCSLDMTRLSTSGFDCFKVVFLCVNWFKGWTRTGTTYLDVEVVEFNELVGLDNLWEVVFAAGDHDKSADSISMQSAALLIDLHLKLTREASAKVNVITRAFIDRVMARLNLLRGKLAEGDKSKVSGIDRCVSLLLNFLTQFKHNEGRLRQFLIPPATQASPAKPAAGSQASRLAEIQPRTSEHRQLVQQLAEICCVSETVAILALRRCNYSLDNGLMILMDDAEKIRLFSDAEKLEGPKAAPPPQQAPQVPDTALAQPSDVLANTDEYFNALFELLQLREINLTKLWTLVTTIPSNERKVKALKELQAPVPWEDLLNARTSPYALLYNVQIIDNVLMAANDNDSPEIIEEKSNWCKLFFLQGGFGWLYHTLKEMLLNEEYFVTSAGQSCLVHSLGILHYFMQVNVKEMALAGNGVNMPTTPRAKNRRALALSFNTKKELGDQIDLADFLYVMLSLTSKIATSSDKVKSDTLTPVIEHTLFMINSVLASRPELLQNFYSFKNDKFSTVTDFVRYLLLDCPAKTIRVSASQTFYQLASKLDATSKDSPLHFFMGLLLANIPSGNHPTCSEFFSLLGNLLADAAKSQDTSVLKNLNFEELIGKVTNEILSRPAEESDRHPDHVVIGYLSLLTALLKERPEFKEKIGPKHSAVQLIHHLFTKCLFFDPNRNNADKSQLVIKFKSSESRAAAYTLLLELSSGCLINTFELCSLVLAHQGDTKSYGQPQEVPRKSYTGYVGLKNLGATCYMNSVMQQFFMMPELRRGFYEASEELQVLPQEDKKLVREIGRMFGWLQESDRQYYDPLSFTKSFKVHGEEVNPMAQQDAEEFFNLLCDQLEHALKDTKHAKLLHETFAGSLHQTLECKVDPSHRSSRAEQDFFTLSLEIQNKNNLEEALDSFFQGEAIQDFMCEKCNKKVEITKRFSLERPANTMIIHLKRFKFDLFTMLKEKLYHYFQFPMRLNMKKYTRAVIDEGQDPSAVSDDAYEYQLSGVVVHSGSAEMGHYYSFIKERVDGTEQWYRFDDTNVSQFDPNNLAVECFGGGQGLMDLDSNGVSDKNVYMLFYERVNRPASNVNNKEMDVVKQLLKNTLPQDMKQMIEVDNLSVWGERLRADAGYSKFLMQFFKQLMQSQSGIFAKSHIVNNYDEEDSSFKLIQFVTHMVFDGVFKARDRQLVTDWMPVVEGLYANHLPACKWLMHKLTADLVHFHSWFEAFLFNSDQFIRDAFVSLVVKVLKALHPAEAVLFPTSYVKEEINLAEGYGGYSNEPKAIFEEAYQERLVSSKEAKKDQQPSGVLALKDLFAVPTIKTCIDSVLAMMESSRAHWRRFHQYWMLVKEIVLLGHEERRYLFSKEIISCFVEYYMGPFSPFWENRGKNRVPLGDGGVSSELTNFMHGFASAIRASKPMAFIEKPDLPLPPTQYPNCPLLPWSALDRAFLFYRDFIASLLKQGYCVDTNAIIVTHLSWEDMKQSGWFISVLFEAFYSSNTTQVPNDLYALQSMLQIEDSLRLWRTALLLNAKDGLLNFMLHSGRKSHGLGEFDILLAFFLELLHSNKRAAGYLFHNKSDWHNPLRKVLTDRIKLADNPRAAVTLEQVEGYRVAVEAIDKFVTDAPVEMEWDLGFDLSDFEVRSVPNYSRDK